MRLTDISKIFFVGIFIIWFLVKSVRLLRFRNKGVIKESPFQNDGIFFLLIFDFTLYS
jgi:hypothetical protein